MTTSIQPSTAQATAATKSSGRSEISEMLGTPETFWGWARHLIANGGQPISEAKRDELHALWAMDETTIAMAKGMVQMALALPDAQKEIEHVISFMPPAKQALYRDPKVQEEILNTTVEWAIKICPDEKWNGMLRKYGTDIGTAYALSVVADKIKEGTVKALDAGANFLKWLVSPPAKKKVAATPPALPPPPKDQFVAPKA